MGKAANLIQFPQTQLPLSQSADNVVFNRLFNNLTLSEKATFSPEQVEILKQACAKLNPRKHSVDLRLSIPYLGTSGFYLVFLAGKEQRSLTRIQAQRASFWKSLSLVISAGALLSLTYIGLRAIALQLAVAEISDPHPTALPWINDKQACRTQGFTWDDGQCWDEEHSPEF
ncbi:MAG: hypothetical protein VKK04_20405 [Synechococcales bacterium]|nr:hypothetical protein [Synechococcales bacterium]